MCRQSDFLRILTEPDHNMLRQQQALLGTEGVALEFAPDAVEEIASLAEQVRGVLGFHIHPGREASAFAA
jgi:ATP-dependent protease HslVU (ClpYQ) ATPase subunit